MYGAPPESDCSRRNFCGRGNDSYQGMPSQVGRNGGFGKSGKGTSSLVPFKSLKMVRASAPAGALLVILNEFSAAREAMP